MCARERERERERERVHCCWHHDTHTHTQLERQRERAQGGGPSIVSRVPYCLSPVLPSLCVLSGTGNLGRINISGFNSPAARVVDCTVLFLSPYPYHDHARAAGKRRSQPASEGKKKKKREREREGEREKARVDTRLSQSRLSRIVPTLLPPPPSSPTHPPCLS